MASSGLPTWSEVKQQLETAPDANLKPEDGQECEICRLEFETERPIAIPCPYNHVFGSECIKSWFSSADARGAQCNTCPKCRTELFIVTIPDVGDEMGVYLRFNDWWEDTIDMFEDMEFGPLLSQINLARIRPNEVENVVALLRLRPRVENIIRQFDNVNSFEEANNLLYALGDFTPLPGAPEEGETELTARQIRVVQQQWGDLWSELYGIWRNAGGHTIDEDEDADMDETNTEQMPGRFPNADLFGESFDREAELNADENSPVVIAAVEHVRNIVSAQNPTTALTRHVHMLGNMLLAHGDIRLGGIRLTTVLNAADIIAHSRVSQNAASNQPEFRRYDRDLVLQLFRDTIRDGVMQNSMMNHEFCTGHTENAVYLMRRVLDKLESEISFGVQYVETRDRYNLFSLFENLLMSNTRYPSSIFYRLYNAAKDFFDQDTEMMSTSLRKSWVRHVLLRVKLIALAVAVRSVQSI